MLCNMFVTCLNMLSFLQLMMNSANFVNDCKHNRCTFCAANFFYWLLGNIRRWDVSILAPCIYVMKYDYSKWLWLWNMGCQPRRGLCGERNYKDMTIVIGTQCYFHVAAFCWPFGHWDKWAVKWLGIFRQTLVCNNTWKFTLKIKIDRFCIECIHW